MKNNILAFILLTLILSPAAAQVNYEIKKLPFNTKDYNEFAAVPYKNGVTFCSDRKTTIAVTYSDQQNNPLTDVYFVPATGSKWGNAEKFSPAITSIFNDGPVSFEPMGSKIYFTRNIETGKNAGKKNLLGIYSGELINGDWMNILPFAYNSNEYATGHPSISADGQKLYFISDMPGGYGGTDIYVCELKDGQWQKPVNLGAAVNTAGNEMFPFIDKKGDLYFSSTGENAKHDLDIFKARLSNGSWEKPKRLQAPVNSDHDDFAYMTVDATTGYFSSNRDGSDDIYSFTLPIPVFEKCDSLKKNSYCFEFFQEGVSLNDSLPLTYEWDLGDGTKVKALETEHCFKAPGTYSIQLNVLDMLTGDVFYNEASYDLEVKDNEQVYIDSPDTCMPGQSITLDGRKTNLKNFNVYEWYWDLGNGDSDTGAVITYSFKTNGAYDVRLGVTTMKDETGNFRKACVYKRVVVTDKPAVKAVIAKKETARKDQKIIPPVQKPLEEVYKVEVAHSKDRIALDDTLFTKLERTYSVQESYNTEKDLYSYTVGEERSLNATWPIYRDVKAKGYDEATVKSYADNVVSLDKLGTLSKSEMRNKIVRVNNALFDAGKYTLTEEAKAEMDKLYTLMINNSDMSVNINAHTDNEGSDRANLDLSEKRAQAIVAYLVSKGIDSVRLIPKGYGESQPIASNDTAEGRKLNRRVEIKINWK